MWIDVHAHLSSQYQQDLDAVCSRASAAGVAYILSTATDLASSCEVAIQATQKEMLFAAVGISPYDAASVDESIYEKILTLAQSSRVVGIGEIGLDRTNPSYPDSTLQKRAFSRFLEIARIVNKPAIIHSRGCEEECVQMCKDAGVQKALFHCFTGSLTALGMLADAGYHVSYSGIATFKSKPLDTLILQTPLGCMHIETDSPYLAPHPLRGSVNSPANVGIIGDYSATVLGMSPQELQAQLLKNFVQLFGVRDDYGKLFGA